MIESRFADDPMVRNDRAFEQRVCRFAKLAYGALSATGDNDERVPHEATFFTAKRTHRGVWR